MQQKVLASCLVASPRQDLEVKADIRTDVYDAADTYVLNSCLLADKREVRRKRKLHVRKS